MTPNNHRAALFDALTLCERAWGKSLAQPSSDAIRAHDEARDRWHAAVESLVSELERAQEQIERLSLDLREARELSVRKCLTAIPQPREAPYTYSAARCPDCDALLDLVRPGKYQHPDCPHAPSATAQPAASVEPDTSRCDDCPPPDYPGDETRCAPCDRRGSPVASQPPDELRQAAQPSDPAVPDAHLREDVCKALVGIREDNHPIAYKLLSEIYEGKLGPARKQAQPDSAIDREHRSLGREIDRACTELPDGWGLRIELERGAGTVYLIDPDGNESMIDSGELFSDQIGAAIDAARKSEGGA